MAPAKPLYRHPAAPQQPELLYGFEAIMGAGGGKAARGGEPPGQGQLIELDDCQGWMFHFALPKREARVRMSSTAAFTW